MEESEEQKSRRFNEDLIKFYNLQGKDSFKHPIVSGKNLDLYKLYKEVIRLGGYQAVLENKLWKDVVTILDLPPSCTSASFTVKRHYKKYLLAYEQTVNKTSLDAKLSDRDEGLGTVKKFENLIDNPNITGMIKKNENLNNMNISQKQIIGQPNIMQEKNFLQKKVMRNDRDLNFFFRNPTGGNIFLKDKSSISKQIRILSAIPDMKRIELAFESHITSEIYWAINVLLIFSSNTNKDINVENQPFLMESITNYLYYCVNNISDLSFIIEVLQGKQVCIHELLKSKVKLSHMNSIEHNNNENMTRISSTNSLLLNKENKKFMKNGTLPNNNGTNINNINDKNMTNPSLSKLRNKSYTNVSNINSVVPSSNNIYNLKANTSNMITSHRSLYNSNKGDFKFFDESNHIISLPCLMQKNIDLQDVNDAKDSLLLNEDDTNEYSNGNKYEEITEYELYENLLSLMQIIRNLSFTVSNEALILKSSKLMNIIFLLFIHSNINDLLLNTLDIITNLSKNIFLEKSPYSSLLLYKLFKCLTSPYRELSEQALECFRKLTLPNGNDSFFEKMPNEFFNEIVNLLISPKNNTRDSALEILYCLSDQSLATKTRLAKIENCIPRLVALICSGKYDSRISKFAACVLSKLAEVPTILKMIMPYEQELFVAASTDDSITKVLLGIISN